jgi:hypothetical protein
MHDESALKFLRRFAGKMWRDRGIERDRTVDLLGLA